MNDDDANPYLDEYVKRLYNNHGFNDFHIPHSDVFFIREALRMRGFEVSIDAIEDRLMELGREDIRNAHTNNS